MQENAAEMDYNNFDFEAFDREKSSFAVKKEPIVDINVLSLMKKKVENDNFRLRSPKELIKTVVKIFAAAAFVLGLFSLIIMFKVEATDTNRLLRVKKAELAASQTQYADLKTKYDSLITTDKAIEIAEDDLGMIKSDNFEVRYFDISGTDGYVGQ